MPLISHFLVCLVLFRIVEDDMPPLPYGASDNLRLFLSSCFNKDPAARPTAEQLFESEWVKWGLGMEEASSIGLPVRFNLTFLHSQLTRGSDSIPFLRRISTEMPRKATLTQLSKSMELKLLNQNSRPESIAQSESSTAVPSTPMRPPTKIPSSSSQDLSPGLSHTLVKTKFSSREFRECREKGSC
jgi:serine/threonine protein kinase